MYRDRGSLTEVSTLSAIGDVADDAADALEMWEPAVAPAHGHDALIRGARMLRRLDQLSGVLNPTQALIEVDALDVLTSFASVRSQQMIADMADPGLGSDPGDGPILRIGPLASLVEKLALGEGTVEVAHGLAKLFDEVARTSTSAAQEITRVDHENGDSWTLASVSL